MSIKRLVRRGLLYWGPNHAVCVVSERVPVKPESRHDSRELPDKAESEPVEKESRRVQHAEPARSSETNRKLCEPASDKRRPKTKKTAGENREPGARPEEREELGEEYGEELSRLWDLAREYHESKNFQEETKTTLDCLLTNLHLCQT